MLLLVVLPMRHCFRSVNQDGVHAAHDGNTLHWTGSLNFTHRCSTLSHTFPTPQVEEALEHAYLASLHDLSDEPVCQEAVNFDFDSEALTPDLVREVSCRLLGGRERVGVLNGWSMLLSMGRQDGT